MSLHYFMDMMYNDIVIVSYERKWYQCCCSYTLDRTASMTTNFYWNDFSYHDVFNVVVFVNDHDVNPITYEWCVHYVWHNNLNVVLFGYNKFNAIMWITITIVLLYRNDTHSILCFRIDLNIIEALKFSYWNDFNVIVWKIIIFIWE